MSENREGSKLKETVERHAYKDPDAWVEESVANMDAAVAEGPEQKSDVENDVSLEYSVDEDLSRDPQLLAMAAEMDDVGSVETSAPLPTDEDSDVVYASRAEAHWHKWKESVYAREGSNASFVCQYDDEDGQTHTAEIVNTTFAALPKPIQTLFDGRAFPQLRRASLPEDAFTAARQDDAPEVVAAQDAADVGDDQGAPEGAALTRGPAPASGSAFNIPDPFPFLRDVLSVGASTVEGLGGGGLEQWRQRRAQKATHMLAEHMEHFTKSHSIFMNDPTVAKEMARRAEAKTETGRRNAEARLQDYLASDACPHSIKQAHQAMHHGVDEIAKAAEGAGKRRAALGEDVSDMASHMDKWLKEQASKVDGVPPLSSDEKSLKERLVDASERIAEMFKRLLDGLKRLFGAAHAPAQR